jgi:small subunit ribosomal protein S2
LATITMKELLEAGVHFGHQTKRWNPKMKEYIFGERNGIYIIDLQKTLKMFKEASKFVTDLTAQGKVILFVGTKRQAQDAIAEEANRCGMFYINQRWLGGLLTNWVTVQKSVRRLQELDDMATDGRYDLLTKKEVIKLERERKHLQANLAGIKAMKRLPDALFVVDSNNEAIAVKEARKLGIPVVAVVDTNCDPTVVDYVIPGNDDALRAIRLFTSKISDSVVEGVQMSTDKQFADATAGATALPVSEAHVGEEAEQTAVPETLEAGADTDAAESEEVDMEAALGGGIRKAPAAVGAAEPEAVAEAHH